MANFPGFIMEPNGMVVTGAPPANVAIKGDMCRLFVNLMSKDGRPMANRKILLTPVPGDHIEQTDLEMITNISGRAEIDLLRGTELEVIFVGTTFLRRITVPDQAVADLLVIASISGVDVYDIVRNVPTPIIRRS